MSKIPNLLSIFDCNATLCTFRSENESAFSLYFTPFTVSQFHSFTVLFLRGYPLFIVYFIYTYLYILININTPLAGLNAPGLKKETVNCESVKIGVLFARCPKKNYSLPREILRPAQGNKIPSLGINSLLPGNGRFSSQGLAV